VDVERGCGRLKICLVTSFPPSHGDLNEYGYHLASALGHNSQVELVILADETQSQEELAGFCVHRCWSFNSIFNPLRLLWSISKVRPDVVWFNIGFSTFARSPLAAFLAIAVPALSRLMGYYTHVTLHTVFERIDLKDAGVRFPSIYRAAGRVATHLLLLANDVSVLLPSFRSELQANYGIHAQCVQARAHGTFSDNLCSAGPNLEREERIILAFGYWGTYKRLDLLLEKMGEIVSLVPNAVLVVAGTNHPSTPGYLESLQKSWLGHDEVQFLGYVPERALPALFNKASVLVLPYSSAAGTSGVVHQACEYGLPMVGAEIPEMVELAREEGIAIEFYPPGDAEGMAQHLIRLLNSTELRRSSSEQNRRAVMPMSQVVDEYVAFFQKRLLMPQPQVRTS
jgi:glycosyltransferase involved in cell wall biosynthesis